MSKDTWESSSETKSIITTTDQQQNKLIEKNKVDSKRDGQM